MTKKVRLDLVALCNAAEKYAPFHPPTHSHTHYCDRPPPNRNRDNYHPRPTRGPHSPTHPYFPPTCSSAAYISPPAPPPYPGPLLQRLLVASPSIFLVISKRESVGSERATGARPELANENGESAEDRNKWQVLKLYEALNARDVDQVQQLLAPDIEWWFHGPPEHQHMMRMLTGADDEEDTATGAAFRFKPDRVAAFGSTVVAEGSGPDTDTAWVHAWTVAADGIIIQVREYFNTSVTITRVAGVPKGSAGSSHCLPIWQSRRPDRARKSFPGLVLAI